MCSDSIFETETPLPPDIPKHDPEAAYKRGDELNEKNAFAAYLSAFYDLPIREEPTKKS
jgi:hypothetical protein